MKVNIRLDLTRTSSCSYLQVSCNKLYPSLNYNIKEIHVAVTQLRRMSLEKQRKTPQLARMSFYLSHLLLWRGRFCTPLPDITKLLPIKHRCVFWLLSDDPTRNKEQSAIQNISNEKQSTRSRKRMGTVYGNSPKDSPSRTSTTLQFLIGLDSSNNMNKSSIISSPKSGSKLISNKSGIVSSPKSGRISNGNKNSNVSSPKTGKQSSFESENEEFLSIISECSIVYTFTNPLQSPSQQGFKRSKLLQLLSLLKSPKQSLPVQTIPLVVSMLSANLFRPLPPASSQAILADLPDEEDLLSNFSLAWPHLQIVYDILLRLVLNFNPKTLRDYIAQPFLVNLLYLFQSEDTRERESLKNVYHRIYSKFTFYRSFMRKCMNDVFLQYVFEGERHPGISDLLEIWGSIINGFTVPLKEEHKLFLMRVLIPLHKTKGTQVYHRQLAYCVNQFVQKEPMLGGVVARGILRYWPITNCQKEALFISELEELVENLDPDQYRKLALPLCTQITRCLNSSHSQVAERALYVWNNEQFVKMASSAIEEVFPVVVEGMEKNLKSHWCKSVKQLTENVKAMVEEMDPVLYEKCLQEIAHKEYQARQEEIKRREKWERVELQAAKNQFLQPQKCIFQ